MYRIDAKESEKIADLYCTYLQKNYLALNGIRAVSLPGFSSLLFSFLKTANQLRDDPYGALKMKFGDELVNSASEMVKNYNAESNWDASDLMFCCSMITYFEYLIKNTRSLCNSTDIEFVCNRQVNLLKQILLIDKKNAYRIISETCK